ncbi:uncharacterized protein DS421_3g74470 [Arachis hypogaea]|nr:uncharacterized protein DS421_3g74470 [Arachis hypogaea]
MTTLPLTLILSSPPLSSSPAQPPTLLSSLFLPSQPYIHKTNAFTHMEERSEKGDVSPVGCGPPSRHRQAGGRSRRRHASPSNPHAVVAAAPEERRHWRVLAAVLVLHRRRLPSIQPKPPHKGAKEEVAATVPCIPPTCLEVAVVDQI